MNIEVNLVAVLLAGIASMVVGFVWYSYAMFAKPWMRLMGYNKENIKETQKKMAPMYALSFVLALITAYILSHVMGLSQSFYQYGDVQTGVSSAFWMWLGFIMPVQATDVIFGGKKWALFAINTGYQLASLLVMGLILGLM